MPQKIVVPADRRLGFFPSITIACLLVACGYLGYLLLAEKSKAEPHLPRQLQPRTLMRVLFVVKKVSG
jgi:hypothetical protein